MNSVSSFPIQEVLLLSFAMLEPISSFGVFAYAKIGFNKIGAGLTQPFISTNDIASLKNKGLPFGQIFLMKNLGLKKHRNRIKAIAEGDFLGGKNLRKVYIIYII